MRGHSKLIITPRQLHAIRQWERRHLPYYGTEAGYQLLLELIQVNCQIRRTLKEFYLSIPYAESTVRLLLRSMESDGWINMVSEGDDKRIRYFEPTEKLQIKKDEWIDAIREILSTPTEALEKSLESITDSENR